MGRHCRWHSPNCGGQLDLWEGPGVPGPHLWWVCRSHLETAVLKDYKLLTEDEAVAAETLLD